ncbi:MAG: electron transfer flavoprotein subunit beta/FixA family protein [Deltaproteobacteria bacterium]
MAFHSIVCVKAVITTAPGQRIDRSSESCALNPFDRPALEMALRLRADRGGTVTALSMGPTSCAFILHEAIAMGVDRGVLISDPALAGSDTLATSTAIAAAIQKLSPFDLVLFGTQSADSDTGHVGPQTAVLLDLPLVTQAHGIEQKQGGLLVERKVDGFRERFDISFPAALTIHSRSAEPRDVSLFGIEKAFEQGEVTHWNVTDLGLGEDQVGEKGSPTRVLHMSRARRQRTCEFLSGSAEEQAEELLRRFLDSGLIR